MVFTGLSVSAGSIDCVALPRKARPMEEYFNVIRWVHVLAGTAWFGAVVLINVAIVPSLADLDKDAKTDVLTALFPKIFKFASVVSVIALAAGGTLLYLRYHTGWSAL